MLINKIPENTKQKQRKPQNEIMGRVSCTKKKPQPAAKLEELARIVN